jgi:hypothetical protein
MALIDKASLLMVPSTYEAGKLYNVLPSGNRAPDSTDQNSGYDQTRADFDFDRGSNTAATRIGSDGLIKKYRENELLQSNQFDTTWAKSNATLTSGQSGYDGSSDAWKIEASGTAQVSQSVSTSGVQTYSVYAKAGTENGLFLRANGGNNPRCFFNLDSGTIGSEAGGLVDLKMADVGDGWYRCSITYNDTTNEARIYVANNSNGFPSSGSIYIQSAQLESGLVSTDYLESTSVTGKAGVLVDLPRINFDANGENGALLLEPSRQQLLQYSEYFAGWDNSTYPITIASNQIASPSGNINASLLTPNSGSSRHAIKETISCSATTYTLSAFYKKANAQYVVLSDGGDTSWHIVTADLENGTITDETNATGTIESYKNDWYRVTCTFTRTNASTIQAFLGASPTDSNSGLPSFNDTSLTTYAYGAQCELGSYPSSYIPNHGESGGVTRAADSCSVTGASDVIGQTEGTLFMDVDLYARDSFSYFALAPNLGSTIAYIGIGITATAFSFEVVNSGVQVAYNYSNSSTGNFKLAFAYKANDFVAYVNGTQVMTDTSGNVPACSQIALNQYDKDQPLLYKQTALFKERLSNAELATLTTL